MGPSLTVNVSPAGAGTIMVEVGNALGWSPITEVVLGQPIYCIQINQKVRITAAPASSFKNWQMNKIPAGAIISANTIQYTNAQVDDGTIITAVFQGGQITNPTVNAGADRQVGLDTQVTLQGSVTNPSGLSVSYQWTQKSGTTVTLTGATTLTPSFTTPDTETSLIFELAVSDSSTKQVYDTDDVTIIVKQTSTPPTVNAGADIEAGLNSRVSLQGSVTNPSGLPVSYQWTQKSGTTVTLTGATTLAPSFTTPNVASTLVFELAASNSSTKEIYDTDDVTVTVKSLSTLVANAGPDQYTPGSSDPMYTVYLDGSRSKSGSGAITSYVWEQTGSVPSGISIDLENQNSAVASFIPDITFPSDTDTVKLSFRLTVDDGAGGSQPASDTVDVIIQNAENKTTPHADAGPDQVVREKATGTLDGSASTPEENKAAGTVYMWYPDGNVLSPKASSGTTAEFTAPDITADHEKLLYQLAITTCDCIKDTDDVFILVASDSYAQGKQAPTAQAQAVPNQNLKPGDVVTLTASGSHDPGVKMFSYHWEIISTDPADMLSTVKDSIILNNNGTINVWNADDDTNVTLTFTVPPEVKSCKATFKLTASDDAAHTGSDTVEVNWVNASPHSEAGPNQTVSEGAMVTLDGSSSTDDGGIENLTFKWEQTEGINVTLLGSNSQTATFRAPIFDSVDRNLYFKLTVTDRAGQTSADMVTIRVNSTRPPVAPSNLKATAASTKITLTWNDNSANETGFRIYKKIGGGAWELLTTTGANVRSYSDTIAPNNSIKAYRYYVAAFNASGTSPSTNIATVPPYQPDNLTATQGTSAGTIKLKWTDQNTTETGFEIYRKSGSCSSTSAWTLVAKPKANSSSWVDKKATPGITYSYRVRAYTQTGSANPAYGYSPFSGCSSATAP